MVYQDKGPFMISLFGGLMGFLFLILMVVPVMLLIMGGIAFYEKSGQTAALAINAGGALIGVAALDFIASLVIGGFFSAADMASLLMIKSIIVSLVQYSGYLCLGFGVYFLSQSHTPQEATDSDGKID